MRLCKGLDVSGYQLVAQLGRGSMGSVWSARTAQGLKVAVKVLRSADHAKMRLRLQREAEILSRLSSPFLARFLDHGVDERVGPFLVSELVEGESLDRCLASGRLDFHALIPILDHSLQGLEHAHALGVVHRDIKPSNLMVTRDEEEATLVRILDFGASKLVDPEGTDLITSIGATLGTIAYMAPEQALDSRGVQASVDLYSLGVILFHALTGRFPHTGRSPAVVITLKAECDAPLLGDVRPAAWPAGLEPFVARLLARLPAARFGSAREARAAWLAVADASRDMVPPPLPVVAPSGPPSTLG
jgi:eukaryotic-like serine/threonine-protein kinase